MFIFFVFLFIKILFCRFGFFVFNFFFKNGVKCGILVFLLIIMMFFSNFFIFFLFFLVVFWIDVMIVMLRGVMGRIEFCFVVRFLVVCWRGWFEVGLLLKEVVGKRKELFGVGVLLLWVEGVGELLRLWEDVLNM